MDKKVIILIWAFLLHPNYNNIDISLFDTGEAAKNTEDDISNRFYKSINKNKS